VTSPRDPHDLSNGLLSEFVDDLLDREEGESVRDHLRSCARCAAVAEDLRRISAAARELGPFRPTSDLWPGIVARLDRGAEDRLPGRRLVARPYRRTPLAAAAVLLVALSGALGWWAGRVTPGGTDRATSGAQSVERGNDPPFRTVTAPPEGAAGVSRDPGALLARGEGLEDVLRSHGDRLDQATLDAVLRHLVVIDRAIEDSYSALALDPGNSFLQAHLERARERRRGYVSEVTHLLEGRE